MTDTYPTSGGGTQVLSPPHQGDWSAPYDPWGPTWTPAPLPGSVGGDAGGYGTSGPPPVWEPPPASTPPRRGRSVAIVLVAALVAALIGVAIGRSLGQTSSPSASSTGLTPGSSSTPGTGSTGSNPFGTLPFGNPAGNGNGSGGSGGTGSSGSSGLSTADAAAIAAKVTPGIVDINTRLGYQSAAAAGTGQVIASSGLVLTNNHVIAGSTTISVTVPSTNRTYGASVVGYDVTEDVAVLQLKGASGLKTVPLGDSNSVRAGDAVVAMGNAEGLGGAPSVVTGTVQSLDQTITASDQGGGNSETLNGLIETDAPIVPGDSGGPLVNKSGQVIGMDTAASSSVERFRSATSTASSFAIPINAALSIAHQIESGQASSKVHIGLNGFLGVQVSRTSTGNGASIIAVTAGTPAASAGLNGGDSITAVNGTSVADGAGLTTALATTHPGDKVTITWVTASGATHSAKVTLGPIAA